MLNDKDTYEQWQEGELNDLEALKMLCQQLDSLQDRLEPLQEQEKVIRARISEVVEHQGGRAELQGFGSLMITNASLATSYNRKALDDLLDTLQKTNPEIGQALANCRQETARSGSLRITRFKK